MKMGQALKSELYIFKEDLPSKRVQSNYRLNHVQSHMYLPTEGQAIGKEY